MGLSGNNEAANIKAAWVARTLDPATLSAIAAIFGYVVP